MNRKQFGLLLVLLIVLGGAGWLVQQQRERAAGAGELGTGQKLMGNDFPINDIASIHIQQGTNEVNLVKKDDLWRVRERNDYPANFSSISETLLKIRDLKVIQSEEITPADLPRLQLDKSAGESNSAVIVDFQNKDGQPIRELTLGKKHLGKSQTQQPFGGGDSVAADGRYVLAAANAQNVLLIADPLTSLQPDAKEWLNKDFFKIERPKAITVTFPEATNSWKLARDTDTGDWKLADAKDSEKLDDARASGVSSPFADPSFTDVMPAVNNDSLFAGSAVVTVYTFDDFTYVVTTGKKSGDNVPLKVSVTAHFPKERIPAKDEKPEDKAGADKAWTERQKQLETKLADNKKFEGWIYLVPSWTVESILKPRTDLLAKKDEPKSADKTGESAEPKSDMNLVPMTAPGN